MYKFSIKIVRKFISIHELRPFALLAMVLASLTNSMLCNVAAASFLALVHLPLLVFQDTNRIATLGSASLVTGGLAKISFFTIPDLIDTNAFFTLGSAAPALGNLLFFAIKIRDVLKNRDHSLFFSRDIALSIALISAAILMSAPLWGPETPLIHAVVMTCKLFIILSTTAAIALILNLRYIRSEPPQA